MDPPFSIANGTIRVTLQDRQTPVISFDELVFPDVNHRPEVPQLNDALRGQRVTLRRNSPIDDGERAVVNGQCVVRVDYRGGSFLIYPQENSAVVDQDGTEIHFKVEDNGLAVAPAR